MEKPSETNADLIAENERLRAELASLRASGCCCLFEASRPLLEDHLQKSCAIVSSLQDAVYATDTSGVILSLNPAFETITGLKREEWVGKTFGPLVHPDDFSRVAEHFAQAAAGVTASMYEARFITQSGEYKTGQFATSPYVQNGRVIAVVGIARDITERKNTEDALRESEERYRGLSEAAFEGIAIHEKGIILEANAALARMFGYQLSEVTGMSVLNMAAPEYREKLLKNILSNHEEPYEGLGLKKDGSTFFVELVGKNIHYRGRKARVTALRDITEVKLAQEALKEANTILTRSPAVAFTWRNQEGWPVEFVTENVERIFGYTAEEFISGKVLYGDCVCKDDLERVKNDVKSFSVEDGRKEFKHEPYRIITKNGDNKFISDWTFITKDEEGNITHYKGIIEDITEQKKAEDALLSSKQLSEDYINSLPGLFYVFDEQRFIRWNKKWNEITGYSDDELTNMYGTDFFEGEDRNLIGERMLTVFREGFSDAEAKLVTKDGRRIPYYFTGARKKLNGKDHLIGLGVDITERNRIEEEKLALELQVQHSQKLESLGVLAGGIAHDFNNLLVGVLGNAELALMDLNPESPIRSYIKDIQTSSLRLADLTHQMLAYSGKGQTSVESLNLSTLVNEMTYLLKRSISKKVEIDHKKVDSQLLIKADANQIRQVVMNLITNAAESYGEECGIVTVSTRLLHADRITLSSYLLAEELLGGDYVLLEVSDIGCGMDKETCEKIFDPFFSTKFTGRGLGLASVLGIVRSHGGAIKVSSKPKKGTIVRILFPKKPVECEEVSNVPKDEIISFQGQGMVLLVDDEEEVLKVGKQMLERIGFTVLSAVDGIDAVQQVRDHAKELVCVLLDINMPRLDGIEAFSKIHQIRADLPVILCSGYDQQAAVKQIKCNHFTDFLHKPFRYQSLVDKLREVIPLKPHAKTKG